MTTIPPGPPISQYQAPPDLRGPAEPAPPAPAAVTATGGPQRPTASDSARAWTATIVTVLILGGAAVMLLTGHDVNESLLLAAGLTLLGVAVARRILTDAAILPTIVIAAAVTAFAVIMLVRGYAISDVTVAGGGIGLITGEVTAWILRMLAPRREV